MGATHKYLPALLLMLLTGCASPDPIALLTTTETGRIELPSREIIISSELALADGAHDLEIVGNGATIKASDDFDGRALLTIENARNITIRDLTFDGNRDTLDRLFPIAPPENALRVWYPLNGVLADQVEGLQITDSRFINVVHYPVLISRSQNILIRDVLVRDSGARNESGRNNLSGGILIEEGSSNFEVHDSEFRNILGNALWTHSLFTSPRLSGGLFRGNRFDTVGRDAIQIGHATRVTVEGNTGVNIGYPTDAVDIENDGIPVAIDTAGDVDESLYAANEFEEVNGKCLDLDGFHNGTVRDNTCTNRGAGDDYPTGHYGIVMNNTNPGTHSDHILITNNTIDGAKYGGLFVMGSDNQITGNRFLNLNLAGCDETNTAGICFYLADEPDMLRSGIYLGTGVARREATQNNVILDNEISGHAIPEHCVSAGPGVQIDANTIDRNRCSEQ